MSQKLQKKKIVGLKELRNNMEEYIQRVDSGDSIVVFRRSKPIFKISPVDEWGDSGIWERVIDFTEINKGGVPAEDVLKALKKMRS